MAWWKYLVSPIWGAISSAKEHQAKETLAEQSRYSADISAGKDPFSAGLYSRIDPKRKLQFLGDTAATRAQKIIGQGADVFQRGVETLGQPLSYYKGLLGSRQEALAAAAPEIKTMEAQAQTAAKAVSEFSPRGGGRVAAAGQQAFTTASDIQGLIEKVRPEAARGMTEIGGLLASLGLNAEQLGLSEEDLAMMEYRSAAGLSAEQRARTDALAGQAGGGAAKILVALIEAAKSGAAA